MTEERTSKEEEEYVAADLKEAAEKASGVDEQKRQYRLLKEQIRHQGIFERDGRTNETPY
jgi:hypothetical protein